LAAVRSVAPSPAIASVLTGVVFLGYLLMQLVNVLEAAPAGPELACSMAVPPFLIGLQYLHSAPRAARLRGTLLPWSLVLQALFTFVPFVAFGWQWGGMAGFFAASLVLMLRPPVGWPLFGTTVAVVVGVSTAQRLDLVSTLYMGVSTALTGLVLFALARLAQLSTAIHESREELARMAVARERLRFARDLHDLLGYSLSSITLKNELIQRLIDHNPRRAREEVAEVLTISRQALADVREVARGYRDMSLLVEGESASSVLKAAGIDAHVDVVVPGLSSTANTILATVLREGVTNLLRHSQPRTCTITARMTADGSDLVRLQIDNDGVTRSDREAAEDGDRVGTGLSNLSARVAAVGGTVTAGPVAPDGFRLVATVAASAEHPAPARPARQTDSRLSA
jgi:two-component system sensor histidine kinase DesK